ncbi:hypothetical protein HUK65_12190 [Rhodobacteraceae bacterium 2376]|uniref:Uncharacterized protein n=1 Tax=Rhabdonatronobacter sediminivivens TaxID=2743469 RepID=A0A7Z0I0M0_9RHOB|nr:hypothetical protein [Rhabdonatronobacter sediminivivens]NYS25753.1 hypothetical protein [Rhabdonatronobacter sediminivivens]
MTPRSYPTLAALTIAFWAATPSPALELPACDLVPGSADSCAPVLACMPGDGVWFVGRAVGWNEGKLEGETNTGVTCTGTWSVGETLALGHARFSCDDGLSGRIVYHYQDPGTGTARGTGLISGFGRLRAWSGHKITEFLDRSTGRVDGAHMCGDTPLLLG